MGERNGDDGKGKKNGHVVEEAPIAAEAKPEKKKSDVAKPTKEDDPKPASEPEEEKTKKSSGGGETKQPVPTTRKGSTGGESKTVPNTPGTAPKTPRHRLPRLQVATRSRTRSLTVLDIHSKSEKIGGVYS